jgi:hypothetical protein
LAEASVIAAKRTSEAKAKHEVGMAGAEVTRQQFKAEADGLVDKFAPMNSMSDTARDHEEFRMSLEIALKEARAVIEAGTDIARENADVLAKALEKANIDIVGGEGHYFDSFAKSLSLGKAVDGFSSKSGAINALLEKFLANQEQATDPKEKS